MIAGRLATIRIAVLTAFVFFGLPAAQAQLQLAPPSAKPATNAPRAKPRPTTTHTKPASKPAATKTKPAPPAKASAGSAEPPLPPGADLAYGAYQRGYYLTRISRSDATCERWQRSHRDDAAWRALRQWPRRPQRRCQKAIEWYRLAADRGDANAMFALAMFNIGGRAGLHDRAAAAALLASAAKLGHAAAAYDLGAPLSRRPAVSAGLHARRRTVPHRRAGRQSGSAVRAWRRSTRRAVASPKTKARRRVFSARLRSPSITDAEVEYAIALFNGTGVAKNEAAAAKYFRHAALSGSPIAQNRLARMLATGRGVAPDPVAAIKWHLIAKAGGARRSISRRFRRASRAPRHAPRPKPPPSRIFSTSRNPALDAGGATRAHHAACRDRNFSCFAQPSSTS